MHEIKCPNCGAVFKVDESGYAEILRQVKDEHFAAEMNEREKILREKYEVEMAASKRAYEIKIDSSREANAQAMEIAKRDVAESYNKEINEKNAEIARLTAQLSGAETEKKLAVNEATMNLARELDGYKKDLENEKMQSKNKELMVRQSYEQQLRDRDDTIERLKDMKARLSTKMVGESLEQHCQNEFNSIRATAFPRAEFGKDNKVSAESGSKGDYIFRDFDAEGNEIVSIMFEMKNENDTTATKHKNEHFFKELDKDRREKGCEYAVLVTLLEGENEFYNRGIVDVSYEYPKMYVIRPQFFLPLIGIITNTAKNALEYKAQLAIIKNQNVDITNFEDKLNAFKKSFMTNSERATKNFTKAIEDIDKSIKNLEDTKRALMLTIQNFGTADKKLEDLTVKRLTRGNETMKKMFEEAEGRRGFTSYRE